jgi:GH15 family glucan-1,4-alpha-glucosidase
MSHATPLIAEHAAIGDCHSIALVAQGSMDWFCPGVFSAPSLFAALLDEDAGGRFDVRCSAHLTQPPRQEYLRGTNVLRTRMATASGLLEVTDFMALDWDSAPDRAEPQQQIVRMLECVAGEVDVELAFAPRPGYATQQATPMTAGPVGLELRAPSCALALFTSLSLERHDDRLAGRWSLRAGQREALILQVPPGAAPTSAAEVRQRAQASLDSTVRTWRAWSARMTYAGPYADDVQRSALTLKLLTHRPTGAVVAAATTSIPEEASGARNWDYRYCWLRDSSLVLRAFVDLGYEEESDAYLRWLLHATRSTRPHLQVVYDVYGAPDLPERVLRQLRGYQGTGPVRVGNAATGQSQLDVYGEVLLTALEFARRGGSLNAAERELLASFCEHACALWREPDQGIWEIRLPPRHNTHSKLMCWAALRACMELQSHYGMSGDSQRLAVESDRIRADIDAHGFNARLHSYVGFYGSDAADASLLIIPRLGYLTPDDARVQGTVQQVFSQLQVDGLLYRYPPASDYDGIGGPEHLFALCNFWAVDCLARLGRITQARRMYEKLLTLRNPVGLYAEEFAVEDGRPIGNFPQAFSHVGLITAALTLAAAERGEL